MLSPFSDGVVIFLDKKRISLKICRKGNSIKMIMLSTLFHWDHCLRPIPFIIDTGTGCTGVLSMKDSKRLGLPTTKLGAAPYALRGIGGYMPALVIHDANLSFSSIDKKVCRETIKELYVTQKDKKMNRRSIQAAEQADSTLGLSFLEECGYKLVIDLKNDSAYLEK